MEWIDASEKPKQDSICLVVNIKYGVETLRAIYHENYDVFVWYNPDVRQTICLDVTHYILEPTSPRFKKE